jgi:hypothetical protein
MTTEIQMLKCQNYSVLSFGLWNLANGIATPRQVGARNDSKVEGLLAMRKGVGNLAGGFVLGAEASGADVDFSWPSFYHNRSSVDIR